MASSRPLDLLVHLQEQVIQFGHHAHDSTRPVMVQLAIVQVADFAHQNRETEERVGLAVFCTINGGEKVIISLANSVK